MHFFRMPSFLLSVLLVIVATVRAQNDDDPVTSEPDSTNTNSNTASATKASASESASASASASATNSASKTAASASASATDAVTAEPSSAASTGGAGVISGSNAPTVTGAVPTYPAATVPPTVDAPYMQKSSLPEGTVFICAGAVLAFAFVTVLAWRAMVAYSLRRSIKKANNGGYMGPVKDYSTGGLGNNLVKPFYSQGMGSTLSLDPLTGGKGGGRNSGMPKSVRDSLFFSPTAGAGGMAAGNRGSGYLPAGYYAAGASVAGGGGGDNSRPISMADFSNSRPQSSGYQRAMDAESPGPSPYLHPTQRTESPYGRLAPAGQSTASLTGKSDGRAPSAYLDDLFDYTPVPQQGTDRR